MIAVCKRFTTEPPRIWAPSCNVSQKPVTRKNCNQDTAAAAAAEAADLNAMPAPAGAAACTAQSDEQPRCEEAAADTSSRGAHCWWEDAAGSSSGHTSDSSSYGSSPVLPAGSSRQQPQQQHQQTGVPSRHTDSKSYAEPHNGAAAAAGSKEGLVSAAVGGGSPVASPAEALLVEVDVVAHEGLTWIEVKNQVRPAGTASSNVQCTCNCFVPPVPRMCSWLGAGQSQYECGEEGGGLNTVA